MFPNLQAEIARKNLTFKLMAQALGMVYETFLNKVSGKTEFTCREMFLIKKTFFPEKKIDYLFFREKDTA